MHDARDSHIFGADCEPLSVGGGKVDPVVKTRF